ncbi:MAG: class I adenylate-forming enzyme family protein [Proteobacteria bacterium]|nr:class I adenylate-forming enzyme family protein [Pseudomonadota bacterium]MDA1324050.1 class I adenylate-forming enzyme family protein [Pseudomonadota bacterium]
MTANILSLFNRAASDQFYRQGHWRDQTIYALAKGHAERRPDGFALRDQTRRLTWRDLVDAVDVFAADLAGRGLVCGQRVAFWMPDRIESVVALLACSRNGLVCCPSPHRNHTVAEVVTLLERMRASVLIYQNGFGADGGLHDIEKAIAHLGSMRRLYRLDPLQPGDRRQPFDALLNEPADRPAAPAPVTDPDSVIYIAFTSGSTGVPKGVMHSDNSLLVTARGISTDWHIGPDSVVYSLSPFSHNLGIGALLTAIYGGAEYVIHDIGRGDSLIDRLMATDTSYLVGVPTHAIDLLAELRDRGMSNVGRLSGFRISGAAVPDHVIADLLPYGIIPQSGYGMTETNGHQYTLPDDAPTLIMESSGKACPGYEIRIFDEEYPNVELPVGQTGQLGGRGASLMRGYFDDQIATESCFNDQGWFMTGDLGWVDEKGYLRLTGRKKEVIIRGGHNINPARIEELAMLHAGVERAAAVAIPDARLGERVCLSVMFRENAAVPVSQLLDHLSAAGLSRYDMPEYYLELTEIPLMSNGKIQKQDIVKWIRDGDVEPAAIRSPEPR